MEAALASASEDPASGRMVTLASRNYSEARRGGGWPVGTRRRRRHAPLTTNTPSGCAADLQGAITAYLSLPEDGCSGPPRAVGLEVSWPALASLPAPEDAAVQPPPACKA